MNIIVIPQCGVQLTHAAHTFLIVSPSTPTLVTCISCPGH